MAEAKLLKYTNALMVKDSRAHVASKSTIIQCIQDIDRKFVQDPDHPSRIKARQRKNFEESCFGTLFLRMHNIVLNAGIIHNMIARQVESLNEGAMEFNFNGNGAIFTRKEFGIITGLKMENTLDIQPPPYSDRIRNTYFGHIHKIKNRDVRDVFMHIKQNRLEYEDDFVRLALIYFLECGLLGKESQVCINLYYLSMLEDLNYFNQYSWGLVSYNATLISLHKALDLHHGELNKSSTYSLGGFPLAFQLYIIGRLRPLNADEEFVYKLSEDLPIASLQRKRARTSIDMEREEYAYFYQQNTSNLGETSIEDVGQPSHSSYNYDELKSCIEALGIKIDGVTNDLGTKIDGVASDLGNFRLESMCQYQSIHNTMGEMFDYIKHAYHSTNHATQTDDVNEDTMVHGNFETRDFITTTERKLNLTTSMPPPTYFNPKRSPPNEVQIKVLTYLTSDDDVTLDYNVCDVNKQFFKEMVEGEWLNVSQTLKDDGHNFKNGGRANQRNKSFNLILICLAIFGALHTSRQAEIGRIAIFLKLLSHAFIYLKSLVLGNYEGFPTAGLANTTPNRRDLIFVSSDFSFGFFSKTQCQPHPLTPEPSAWCHLLSLRQLRCATAETSLLVCPNGSVSQMNNSHPHKKPITAPIPKSQVLGKVRDFLGVISEANEKLKIDAKENSVNYDIEVLTRNESQIIEMDLMLGIADLHTPGVVAAAESSITGCQPVIPLAVSSSGTESEDRSNGNDDSDKDDSDY
ncbi:hypothetical protein FNV43_RR00428 [Rhamnella rubrinervis]|uniref:DUF1985 domain-containing protein n=1 Tax=Rhamnella rubrinervis TaxID=2594499 RepID=A0A8K0HNJ9_9ROSA|nr:hypothetical protein FNV43_RR00428 [Rhamnella rubrinervis]